MYYNNMSEKIGFESSSQQLSLFNLKRIGWMEKGRGKHHPPLS
jgi:hypothetical protein